MPETHSKVIGPNPSPEPPLEWDARIIMGLALLYLAFLILTRGVAMDTAISMASQKYSISEDALRKTYKDM